MRNPRSASINPILAMLVLGTVAGAATACDTPPVAPTPLESTNTLTLGCNGRTSTAKLVDDTWEVTVVVPGTRSCIAYPCTFREAEQIQTPQEAIVECRRLYGITGSNA